MRTDLAYIEAAAEAATHTAKETVSYAGFQVEREVESEQLRSYKSDVEALRKHLEANGVKPLAILPRAWWNSIVKRSRLIEVGDGGAISLAPQSWMLTASTVASVAMMVAFFAASVAVVSTIAYFLMGAFGHWDVGDAVLIAILSSAMATAVFMTSWVRRLAAAKLVTAIFGAASVLYDMWSNEEGRSTRHYSYDFPIAPADVQETLRKLSSRAFRSLYEAKVRVSAVPEAFTLRDTTVSHIVAREIQSNWEAAKQRIIDELNDPIVVVQYAKAVAIVAQFGEFPIEKEIVDKVVGKGLNYDREDD